MVAHDDAARDVGLEEEALERRNHADSDEEKSHEVFGGGWGRKAHVRRPRGKNFIAMQCAASCFYLRPQRQIDLSMKLTKLRE